VTYAAPIASCGIDASASFAEYPERPIRQLLPFPAGSAVDIVARTMAAKMSEDLGKPFIIENKSGGELRVRRKAVIRDTWMSASAIRGSFTMS
jgi:tripartite-type tricarboxylate transporter receptor subunit TctC